MSTNPWTDPKSETDIEGNHYYECENHSDGHHFREDVEEPVIFAYKGGLHCCNYIVR